MKIEKGVGYVLIKDLARGGLCDCMWAVRGEQYYWGVNILAQSISINY